MKRLFSAIILLLCVGCVAVPINKEEDVCATAQEYVVNVGHNLNEIAPDTATTRLEYCRVLEHGNAYFIYSGVQNVKGVENASELHVLVVLGKVNNEWHLITEYPIAKGENPEARHILQERAKNQPLNVHNHSGPVESL